MAWAPEKNGLGCAHCGAVKAVAAPEQFVAAEHDLDAPAAEPPPAADGGAAGGGLGLDTTHLACKTCAAEMKVPPGAKTGRCPFCGSDYVIEQKSPRELEAPESVLPLKVGAKQAKTIYLEWVGRGFFTPRALKKDQYLGALSGFYIPAWAFDADAGSEWTAERGHYYYTTERYTDSQGNEQTREERRVRWEAAAGARRDAYRDLMVPAARDDIRQFLERAGEFSLPGALRPYRPEYLAGWSALAYTLDRAGGWAEAQARIEAEQEARCSGDVGGDTQRDLRVSTTLSAVRYKHTLLPYWISGYKFRGKTYRFVINGETGAVAGEKPVSWLKVALVAMLALALLALFALLSRHK